MLEQKDWTVMIYMAGDNNLSIDMAYTLEELQKKVAISENDNVKLFVHYENNSPEIPSLYCDFSDSDNPTYQYSTEIKHTFQNNQTISEAVDPVVDFVDWCTNKNVDKSNTENYALIFSGHTMGFLSMGLLKDESKDVSMTLPTLQKGLERIKDKIIGKKLAMLGFDSCVMSMFEVGQQFTNVAETMIASEGSIPNAGWSYAEILGSLANTNESTRHIAGEFVQKYIEKQSKYSIGGVSVDMAAWDLSKLNGLNNKFGRLTTNLLRCFEDESSIIYKQMRRVLLQVHFNSQAYMYEQCLDLGDFCSLLIEEVASVKDETGRKLEAVLLDVSESSKAVLQEISKCVILSGFSGGTYQYSTGISLFFPWSLSAYNVSANDYEQLSFVNDTSAGKIWNQFLQKYLGEVSLRKAKTVSKEISYDLNQISATSNNQMAYAHRLPTTPLTRLPTTPLTRLPSSPLTRLPSSPLTRLPTTPLTRLPNSPLTRLPSSPLTRLPSSPLTRLPTTPLTRLPSSPLTRLPTTPLTRLPTTPLTRMAGNSNQFFENFTNFKNIESRWNIMGYTKDIK